MLYPHKLVSSEVVPLLNSHVLQQTMVSINIQRAGEISFYIACLITMIGQLVWLGLSLLVEGLFCGWDPRKWPKQPTGSDLCFPWKYPGLPILDLLCFLAFLWFSIFLAWVLFAWLQQRLHGTRSHPAPLCRYEAANRRQNSSSRQNDETFQSWDKEEPDETTTLLIV